VGSVRIWYVRQRMHTGHLTSGSGLEKSRIAGKNGEYDRPEEGIKIQTDRGQWDPVGLEIAFIRRRISAGERGIGGKLAGDYRQIPCGERLLWTRPTRLHVKPQSE